MIGEKWVFKFFDYFSIDKVLGLNKIATKDDIKKVLNPLDKFFPYAPLYFSLPLTTEKIDVIVKWARIHPDAKIPMQAHKNDIGYDICSVEYQEILPGKRKVIRTGLKCEYPPGFEMQVGPRSGLARDFGLVCSTGGIIDPDYRGELLVVLINTGDVAVQIFPGMRIAQVIMRKKPVVQMVEIEEWELSKSDRGEGGFGSTGN